MTKTSFIQFLPFYIHLLQGNVIPKSHFSANTLHNKSTEQDRRIFPVSSAKCILDSTLPVPGDASRARSARLDASGSPPLSGRQTDTDLAAKHFMKFIAYILPAAHITCYVLM